MKECPHCHELLGDSAENCFNCHYNFRLGRVPNDEDQEYLRQIDASRVDREQNFQMYKAQEQFQDEQIRLKLKEDIATIQQNKLKVIMQNPYYEYDVVQLKDSKLGYVSADRLQKTIYEHSSAGWRLSHMSTNLVNTSTLGASVGGFGNIQNVGAASSQTTEITTLIFERCIKPAKYI